MRPALLISLLLTACSSPEDPTQSVDFCDCAPRALGDSGSATPWKGYTEGIQWHRSLAEVSARAKKEQKLVFYFHVVGDLDMDGC